MREDKDRSGQWMIERHGDGLLYLSGVRGFRSWRAAKSEVVLPKQVPDGLLEVLFPEQTQADLFLLEIESYPEQGHEKQVMDDLALVLGAKGVLPEVISVVLRPRGSYRLTGQQQVDSRLGFSQLSFRWRVVELWNVAAEDLLAADDVGIIPWVPLTRYAGPPEALIQQCRDRIDQQARPEEHANLLAVTQVMTRLAYNNPDLLKILGGSRAMIESPLLQEFEAQVEVKARHEDILQNLEARFGSVPPELAAALRQIPDRQRLRELHRFAVLCPDLEAFRMKISSATV